MGGEAASAVSSEAPGVLAARSAGDEPFPVSLRRMFDAILAAAVVVLALLAIVALVSDHPLATVNGTVDVMVNTLTTLAAAGAAALAWIRYRIERDVAAIYESAAFLLLCVTRGLIVGIAAFGDPSAIGMSIDQPQQWPLYAWSLARLVSAVLLVVAASATLRRAKRTPLPAWLVEVLPIGLLLASFVVLRASEGALPTLLPASAFAALRGSTGGGSGMAALGILLQAVIGVTYLVGAVLYRRLLRERGAGYAGYLALALVVAAFSQVHWALSPGIYRPLVTVDDLLRALFSLILLLGIEAQFRAEVRGLRLANSRLRAARERDAERAILAANARLARDVHDGLSQDLWLAKMEAARLTALDDLPPAAAPILGGLTAAVDRALGDARLVVGALREESGAVVLGDAIQRIAGEFEGDTGIIVTATTFAGAPDPPPAASHEIVQVLREALSNVRRHADATTVSISLAERDSSLVLTIADNGRGFDARSSRPDAFGLRGMQERAALIGGSIDIESRPADGTQVTLTVPARDREPTA